MGDYGKLSNFNPKANFNMVRFGADTPITEYELNEAQQILDYKQKQLAKSVGDRFTKVGTMSISETLDAEGTKTLILEDNDLLVDGEPIHISTLSTPIQEGETAYLKIFEKEVSKDSEIKEYGNEQHSETLENELLDPRLEGIETARRLQTCYNIETQTTLTKESFATENGVKEFSCKNGYIDNIAMEGKTLVNLYKKNMDYVLENGANSTGGFNTGDNYEHLIVHNFTGLETFVYSEPITQIQQGKEYTLIVDVVGLTIDDERDGSFEIFHEGDVIYGGRSEGLVKVKFTSNHNSPRIRFDANNLAWVKFKDIIILEGDHTDKPISYFEGLKSVGQGDKIDVVSYGTTEDVTKELLDSVEWIDGSYIETFPSSAYGNIVTLEGISSTETYIPVEPNTTYIFDNINHNLSFYDLNKGILNKDNPQQLEQITTYPAPYINGLFSLDTKENIKYIKLTVLTDKKDLVKIYKRTKYDKKQISTTLRSLPNGVKDTIEKRGNKYVKVQRCGEYVINNTSGYSVGTAKTDTIDHCIAIPNIKSIGLLVNNPQDETLNIYCDTLKEVSFKYLSDKGGWNHVDEEFITHEGNYVVMALSKAKVNAQGADAFYSWVKDNPITIVYELETPIIIELPNFNPQIFEGNMTFLINTGVIQGECEFDVYTYQEPVFEEDITYIPLMQLHQGVEKDLRITDPNRVNYKSLNKDDNGQFTRVEVYRQNNTLKEVSELSELVDDNYTRQTITYYDELGVSVLYSEIYSLEYDEDGDLIGQELIKRC